MHRMIISGLLLCLVAALALALGSAPAYAKSPWQGFKPPRVSADEGQPKGQTRGPAQISSVPVCNLEGFDGTTFQCVSSITGSATVVRSRGGITAVVDSSGLEHNEAATLWFFVIEPDETELLVYAGGHVVGKSGTANFAGHFSVGREVTDFLGNSVVLSDPFNSIVVLVVRSHGQAVPGYVSDQIGSFNGGCNPGEPNEGQCQDKQIAVIFP